MKFGVVFLVFSLLMAGCYYDSEEDLYPSVSCDTSNISYSVDIVPIMANSCLNCHFNGSSIGGGLNLEGHAALKASAENGSLVGSVTHASGFSAMPKGASKLDECKILKIKAWVQAGSPDN
mgnify:CR=1 FL=1